MRRRRVPWPLLVAVAALLLLSANLPIGSAQSLGDVARREAERRTQVEGGRLYTNDDLARVDASTRPPTANPAEGVADASSDGVAEPVPVIVEAREKRDETYWRALNRELRGRLAKANAAIVQWEARLAELDIGPKTPTLIREREVVTASLSRLRRDARSHSDGLTRFLTRAQVANVKEEWIR